jgi:hypothetical protein
VANGAEGERAKGSGEQAEDDEGGWVEEANRFITGVNLGVRVNVMLLLEIFSQKVTPFVDTDNFIGAHVSCRHSETLRPGDLSRNQSIQEKAIWFCFGDKMNELIE